MKKYIVHNFSFYSHVKIYKNSWDEKNIKYQTNISLRYKRELPFQSLKMKEHWSEMRAEKNKFVSNFLLFY